MEASKDIARLVEIMAALRDPQSGCPWDVKQDFQSIKPYTIEEAYEVADAIERDDLDDLCDELGDLLLQVVFHARMAEEAGAFDFGDVVHAITRKMIRRHPHVFAGSNADTPEGVKLQWEDIKAAEKAERAERRRQHGRTEQEATGLLDGVSRALPALSEAIKLQHKAARVGFDWSEAAPVLAKIEEELGELRGALELGDKTKVEGEFGDLVFALVNLGRHVGADPEMALRGTNGKFRKRFAFIEKSLGENGEDIKEATLERMETLWGEAKAHD
ncbi:nucleoside triphosphate pyrophosphohydrolase [Hoeflea sp. TYP-13]|uniref:nucleoside triphosphate pyrophosphohydrolase n=1 Tax=Hoeflea sp. TYP-13 TaxID=3230023 RepID=UPI0034C6AF1E